MPSLLISDLDVVVQWEDSEAGTTSDRHVGRTSRLPVWLYRCYVSWGRLSKPQFVRPRAADESGLRFLLTFTPPHLPIFRPSHLFMPLHACLWVWYCLSTSWDADTIKHTPTSSLAVLIDRQDSNATWPHPVPSNTLTLGLLNRKV